MRTAQALRTVAFAAWVAASATPTSAAGPPVDAPPAPTTPIAKVTVDLAARTFDRVLPFDVPFFVSGTAPDGTVELHVQYTERRRRNEAESAPKPATPAIWKPEVAATGSQSFLVFIAEPLDAERYYRFRLTFHREPSPKQATEFRDKSRAYFDERLALIGAGSVPGTDAPAIRQDLVTIVKSVTGTEVDWKPAPGTLFDTNDTSAKAIVAFLEKARPVLAPQVERGEILPTFVDVQLQLRTSLNTLRTAAPLSTAVAAARKLNDTALDELLRLDADGLTLLTLAPLQVDLAAAGGVTGDLKAVWRPEGAVTRGTNFATLRQRLEQLEHFARAVADTGGSARALVEPAIGAPAVAAIAALFAPGGALPAALSQTDRQARLMSRLAAALKDRDAALVSFTEALVLIMQDERFVEATTVADGATTQNNYISADGGLLYAGDIGQAALFVGTNIYLRPVNKDAPLSQRGSFGRRFAFTVGVTVSSIADDNGTRTDMFADSSLVLGAGLRVTQSIRVGAGALVFKESDPNPLVTKKTAAATWYLSFSFDINVAKGLEGLGGEFK
jgi:hypothetical protein